ncbi:MAG: haloacid dehalogenase-like hydrolase, partial [Myxococcales bacterium]|nr:haloacid dehalogenase-like hydrolase [Myxococcales bacterium]
MSVAFFDLDRTILSKNSGALWVRSELQGGHIGPGFALKAMAWMGLYHLGYAEFDRPIRLAVARMRGVAEREVLERTELFYERSVRALVRPGARRAIAEHRARGEQLVLLTSSSNYLSDRFVEQLSLDAALCNRFELDPEGCYTGELVEPICFGPGKVLHAQRFADAQGARL